MTYNSAQITVGLRRSWINRTQGGYQGTYILPISDMSDNIGEYSHKNLKKNLAKYSAREKMLKKDDSEEVQDDILRISKEVTKIVIDEGPFVCSECLELKHKWEDMESGLYTRIRCEDNC
jgi:hypothetical protein